MGIAGNKTPDCYTASGGWVDPTLAAAGQRHEPILVVLFTRSERLRPSRSSVQFSSVQDGVGALRKTHMRFTTSLRSVPNVALETVPMLV